ncbi:hypothetical protein IKQ26_08885 [bacterium]|nr:hypothetical protein [bacterium]
MKKILKISLLSILSVALILYSATIFLLPQVINNKAIINKLQKLVYNKCGIETQLEGLNLKVSPKLGFDFKIDSLIAKHNDISVVDIKNLSLNYEFLQNYLTYFNAKNIYVDGNNFDEFASSDNKNNTPFKFNLKKLPKINIENLAFESENASVYAKNIESVNDVLKFQAQIKTPYLNKIIELGNSGSFNIADSKFKADRFEITLGNSHVFIDGLLVDNNNNTDFTLKGENLPVSELVPIILHAQKFQDPTKKFIENAKDHDGSIDIDLKINNDGVWGKSVAKNFSAKSVMFDIPFLFKETVFNFNGNVMTSESEGLLGNEKVVQTLQITNLTSEDNEVTGTLNTTLTKKFNYVPDFKILNSAKISLLYKIKFQQINVFYNLDIPENSDLIFNTFYLGLRNYKRKIFAETLKVDNDLYLKDFGYSIVKNNKENIIVKGDGFFKKVKDDFIPQYINCQTDGYAPVSVTGSFGEKLSGGEFSGKLQYDYLQNKIFGNFDIINARYKEFKIDKALVKADDEEVVIKADGTLNGEKYSASMSAKNDFNDRVTINRMKLFLDKLILATEEKPVQTQPREVNAEEITKKVNEAPITIHNWQVLINEIRRGDHFELKNVDLSGALKNHVFDFNMKELSFADGTINANGAYNFKNNSAKMSFEAKNINSNKAAFMMLNLQDQIEGTANAKFNLVAKDLFRFLDVHSEFEIKDGFLPRLGDTEFMLKNSKYTLSQITNYDLSQKETMSGDIKGSFDVHNTELKNIYITAYNPEVSYFIEGDYEMEKQYADLQLFSRYSKDSSKGVRIFSIPLSWILKVAFRPEKSKEIYQSKLVNIPEIPVDEKRTVFYRIQLKGDINNNDVNLVLKEIK